MIFVTVGTQFPFDRLISAIDNIERISSLEVFAQIGEANYFPKNFSYSKSLTPDEFEEKFSLASVIVSHAGMGTIITAALRQKPIIIVPRDAELGEHRNQHQFGTCKMFSNRRGVFTCEDLSEIGNLLNNLDAIGISSINDKNVDFSNSLDTEILKLFKR